MKLSLILKYSFLLLFPFFSCTEQKKEVLTIEHLNDTQVQDWMNCLQTWQKSSFTSSHIAKFGFKQDCIDCGNLQLTIHFEVNNQGHIDLLKRMENNFDCTNKTVQQKEILIKEMLNSFSKVQLPKSLHKKTLKLSIGRVTKC